MRLWGGGGIDLGEKGDQSTYCGMHTVGGEVKN